MPGRMCKYEYFFRSHLLSASPSPPTSSSTAWVSGMAPASLKMATFLSMQS